MPSGLRAPRSSPLGVAAVVLVLYAGWAAYAHSSLHHRWSDFAFVGTATSQQSSVSPVIDADRSLATSPAGYDGQFFLYIAQDPTRAKAYIDDPPYRYGRIAYPLTARALALARQDAIPFMLVAINVFAVALGTFALATLLRRHGRSPWYALIFALYPGVYVAVQRDLSEALAYALAACAVALFDRGRRRDLIASSVLFAVAVLTRETTVVFALVCAGLLAARDRGPRRAAMFVSVAVLPYVFYREVLLRDWFGRPGIPSRQLPTAMPFEGIASNPWGGTTMRELYSIVLPGVLCLVLAAWALPRRRRDVGLWALAANVVLYVILLPPAAYGDIYASTRVTTGVVTAFVIAIPTFVDLRPSFRWWGGVVVLAWLAPWWVLYDPSWFPYGHTVSASPTPTLEVSVQGSTRVAHRGQEVDFTVWSTDSGSIVGYADVVLEIELPPGLTLVGPPYHERGSGCNGTTTITCPLDSLSPHMGTPVRFGVRFTGAATSQTMTALLSADGLDTPRRASFTVAPG